MGESDSYPPRFLFHFDDASGCYRSPVFRGRAGLNSALPSQKARKVPVPSERGRRSPPPGQTQL